MRNRPRSLYADWSRRAIARQGLRAPFVLHPRLLSIEFSYIRTRHVGANGRAWRATGPLISCRGWVKIKIQPACTHARRAGARVCKPPVLGSFIPLISLSLFLPSSLFIFFWGGRGAQHPLFLGARSFSLSLNFIALLVLHAERARALLSSHRGTLQIREAVCAFVR